MEMNTFEQGLELFEQLGGVGRTPELWYKANRPRILRGKTISAPNAPFPFTQSSLCQIIAGGPSREDADPLLKFPLMFTRRNVFSHVLRAYCSHLDPVLVDVECDPKWPIEWGFWPGKAVRNMSCCLIETQDITWARVVAAGAPESRPWGPFENWTEADTLHYRSSGEAALELAIVKEFEEVHAWGIDGGVDGEHREKVKELLALADRKGVRVVLNGWRD